MIQFFSDCARLFNNLCQAMWAVPFFKFLQSYLYMLVLIGLFMNLSRGTKKM